MLRCVLQTGRRERRDRNPRHVRLSRSASGLLSMLLTYGLGFTEHHPAPVRGSDGADLVGDHREAESAVEGHVALLLRVDRETAGSRLG